MAHPGGRPRRLTPEVLQQIVILHYLKRPWKEIGLAVGLASETCRRADWERRKAPGTVGNSPVPPSQGVLRGST